MRLVIDGPTGRITHTLSLGAVTLGRTPDNAIPLAHDQVSRRHAEITLNTGGCWITDLGSTNGTFLNGTRLAQQRPEPFRESDRVQIGPFTLYVQFAAAPQPITAARALPQAPEAATLAAPAAFTAAPAAPPATLDLRGRAALRLGRAPDNDVVINHPQASRYHAILEQVNTVVKLTDLGSANGTFVNGQRITAPTLLNDGNTIQIASYRFVLRAGQIQQFDDQGNVALDALHLVKIVGKGLKILDDVSVAVQPREFVAIVGGSGAGKSTLLDALNGFRPATAGAVLYNGADLYQNFDAYRSVIGYVPQDDIIHRELTVYGALNYAAQLRLPRDTTPQERRQRIAEVLKDLGLEQRRDTPINRLSGGQRKRVSIGVELLTKPSLFFLDEPTSGLDPSTETKMMRLMRELANQGRTVVLVTHVTGNVSLCDKVIIMARGGRLVFYGPPQAALQFFQVRDFVDIYDQVETGNPEDWQKKFEQSAQFRQYVAQPLTAHVQNIPAGERARRAKPGFKRISAVRQFLILSLRNLEILVRDRASLTLMLLVAPLVALLDFLTWKPNLFDVTEGNAIQAITMLFAAALICILVGALSSMREIVKEVEVYRRERMVGLGLVPYIFSKAWLGAVLALYQALIFVLFKVIAIPSMPRDPTTLFQTYITLTLAALSGMLMGLFVSAASPNQNVAPLLTILLVVPQILFGGGMLPPKAMPNGEIISAATSTRWGFNTLVTITKMGIDVADDKCWQLATARADPTFTRPPDANDDETLRRWQNAQDEEYKRQNCNCLGPNIFTACKFPGILKQYTAADKQAVEAREPRKPAAVGDPPAQPNQPPAAPAAPSARPNCNQLEPACQQQIKDWNAKLDSWTTSMDNWKKQMDDWKKQMDDWKGKTDTYKKKSNDYEDAINAWQDEYKDWKGKRDKATANAEGLVRKVFQDYGDAFKVDLMRDWGILGIIMGVFFVLIFAAQKYKDIAGK